MADLFTDNLSYAPVPLQEQSTPTVTSPFGPIDELDMPQSVAAPSSGPGPRQPQTFEETMALIKKETAAKNPFYGSGYTTPNTAPYSQARKYLDEEQGYMFGVDNDDFYAQRQSGLATLGAGLAKLIPLTIAKTGQGLGFVGSLFNPANMFSDEGYFASATNNAFSNAFASMEDKIKNEWGMFKTFQEAEDRDKGFWSRAFTDANFWADEAVDGAAFLASAYLPGAALSKLGMGMKIAKGLSRFGIGAEAAGATIEGLETVPNYLKNAQALASKFDKGLTWATATTSEAMFEAKGVRDNLIKALENSEYTQEEKDRIIGTNTRNTFLMNAGLLGFTNFMELKYLYKALGKVEGVAGNMKQGLLGEAFEAMPVAPAVTRLEKFLQSPARTFIQGVTGGVAREGFIEENAQLAIQRFNEQNGAAGKVTGLFDIMGLGEQYLKQTAAAIMGDDPENAVSIGLGGILGGIPGGIGSMKQAKADKITTDSAIAALNLTQQNWLKYGNIFKTAPVEITGPDGKKTTENRIVLDQNNEPIQDDAKLAAITANFKANVDLLDQADKTNDKLKQTILRDKAFANFVTAHINAGIEDDLFAKLDSAISAKPEDLINLGFDPAQDYKQQIQDYKSLAADIIKQTKLINDSILIDDSATDKSRKDMLTDMAATQSIYKKLANQINKDGVEIQNELVKNKNTSLTDGLVDQLNTLQFRIDSMKEVIAEREKLKNPTPLRNQLYKDVLAELEEAKKDLIAQNETSVSALKKKGEYYNYEKKERAKDPLAKGYEDKLKLQGQIENEVRVDALQIGKFADARNGKQNFLDYTNESIVPVVNDALKSAERERNKPEIPKPGAEPVTGTEEIEEEGDAYDVEFDTPEGVKEMQIAENTVYILKDGKKTNKLKIVKFQDEGENVKIELDGKEAILDTSLVASKLFMENWELVKAKPPVKPTSTDRKKKREEGDEYTDDNEQGDDIDTDESDDGIIDGEDSEGFMKDRGPKWENVKFRKTISLEFLDKKDTILNTKEGTDRFHRFVNKHNLANRYYELQVITKENDPFADENGKNGIIPKEYPDTIKVVVVKGRKMDDGTIEYDYVDENNNIIPADEATADNIIYTAIPDMNEWTVERVQARYTVDKLTLPEEIQLDINKQMEWQNSVKERIKNGEDVFLKVLRTSPGVTRIEYTSATDENGKRQMAQNTLVGRLVEEDPDWGDLRSISNPDNNIALRVATANGNIPGIKAGHLVMQEFNYDKSGNKRWGDKITKVFNRKLSEKEKGQVINALVRLSEIFVKKFGTKRVGNKKPNKLSAAEAAEEKLIVTYLKGVINWSRPTKKQDAAKHFWIDSGLHFGNNVIKLLKKDILANKEKILKNVYHNVNNTMLTESSSFTELKFAFGKAEAGKVYDTYEQYLLEEKSTTEPPAVYTSMPLYDSEVPQRTGVYILWKDESTDVSEAEDENEEEEEQLQHRRLKIPTIDKDINDFVSGIKKTITVQNAKLRMQIDDDGGVVITINTSKGKEKTATFSSLEDLQNRMAEFVRDIKYYTGYSYGTVTAVSDELIKRIRQDKQKKLAEKKKDEIKKTPAVNKGASDPDYVKDLFQQMVNGKPLASFTEKEQKILNNPIFKIRFKNLTPTKGSSTTTKTPASTKQSTKKPSGAIPGPYENMHEAVNNAVLDGGYLRTSVYDLDNNVYEVQVPATEITQKKKQELLNQIIKQIQNSSSDEEYRLAFTEDVTRFEEFAELEEFMKANLPQFSINRTAHLINGKAWGSFKNHALYIYEKAAYGTGFHEAFEGVWKHYLTDREQNELLQEFRSRKGEFFNPFTNETKNYADASMYDVREMLAEEFIDYIENDGANVKSQPKTLNFFQKLWNYIKKLFGLSTEQLDELDNKINKVYKKIVTGGFANVKSVRETALAETEYRAVPGFSQKETSEIMEGLAYNFFLELYKQGSNIDTLFNSMTKEESNGMLRTLYGQAYNVVSAQLTNLSPKYTKLFAKQKDLVYERFRQYLSKFGAVFSEVEVDEANVSDTLGIKDSISVNPKSLTSVNVMMLISSLPYRTYNRKTGNYPVARNGMNQQRLVDAGRVHTLLLNELSNIVPYYDNDGNKVDTFNQMMETLDSKYKLSNGVYKEGYAWIMNLQQRLKYNKPLSELTQDDILLRVAFTKSFSNIKYQPEKLIVSQEGNIYSINPLANKNQDRIRKEWANQLKVAIQNRSNKLFKLGADGEMFINENSVEFEKMLEYLDNKAIFKNDDGSINLYPVYDVLESLGISFTAAPEEMTEYALSLYDNTIQIMTQIVDGNIKKVSDIFNGNVIEERIKYFTNVEAVYDAEDNLLTYLNGDGEMQYSVGISSLYGNMVNILNTVRNQHELVKTCPWLGYIKTDDKKNEKVFFYPYQQNSELLRAGGTLFDKKGNRKPGKMQYHILAGTGVSDVDGVNTSKLQFPERVAFKIHYLMDNVAMSIINSDKNQEFGIGIPEKNTIYSSMDIIQKFLSGKDIQKESNNFITKYINQLADEMAAAEVQYNHPVNIQYYQDSVADLGHFRDVIGETLLSKFQEEVLETGDYTIQEFIEAYESDIVKKITEHVNTQIDRTVDLFTREDIFFEPSIPGMLFKNGLRQTTNKTYMITDAIDNDKLNKLLNLGDGSGQMLSFNKTDGKYSDYVERVGYTEQDIRALAAYVAINEELLAGEQHKMIYGHPAMYKDLPKRANGATSTKEPIIEDAEVIDWMDENMARHDGKRRTSNKHQTFRNISFQDVDVVSLFHKEKAEAMYADLLENKVAPALAASRVGGVFDKNGKLTGYKLDKEGKFTGALAGYLKMTEADAMAFILPDMLRDLLFLSSKFDHRRDAQWNYNMAYEKLVRSGRIRNQAGDYIKKGDPAYRNNYTATELDAAQEIYNQGDPGYQFEVLKTQYFGYVNSDNLTHPSFLKHSVQPKFYKDVEGTHFEKLYLAAQKNKVDVIGFESGQKVGNVTKDNGKFVPVYDANGGINIPIVNGQYELPSELALQDLFTRFYGIQVEQNSKPKKYNVRGSQITKVVMTNFYENGEPVNGDPKLKKLIEDYHETLKLMFKQGKETLLKEIGLKKSGNGYKTTDLSKLVNILREEAENRDLADNVIDAINAITLPDGSQELQYEFDTLINRDKIDYILNSILDSRVISQKIHGKSSVQVASTLYETNPRDFVYLKDGIYQSATKSAIAKMTAEERSRLRMTSNNLQFYRNDNGQITGMETYISWPFSEVTPEELGLKLVNGVYLMPEGGIPGIDNQLLKAIGFRIPTQAPNSIESIIIKGFTPASNGDMIVVPSEIVGKAGSDFDIDKINLYLPVYELDHNQYGTQQFKDFVIDYLVRKDGQNRAIATRWINKLSVSDIKLINQATFTDIGKEYHKASNSLQDLEGKITDVPNSQLGIIKRGIQQFNIQYKGKKKLTYITPDTTTPAGLQNKFMEITQQLITHPLNYGQLITPNSTANLKSLATEISAKKLTAGTKIRENEKSPTYLRSFVGSVLTRERYLTAKRMVGIAALHTTFHTMAQQAGTKINGEFKMGSLYYLVPKKQTTKDNKTETKMVSAYEPISIKLDHKAPDKNNTYSIGHVSDTEGIKISDSFSESTSGFVDGAKDPFVFDLNFSLQSTSTWFYLKHHGVPERQVAYFMNQPIIDQYLALQAKNKSSFKKINEEQLTREEMMYETIAPWYKKATGIDILASLKLNKNTKNEFNIKNDTVKVLMEIYNSVDRFDIDDLEVAISKGKKADPNMQLAVLMSYLRYEAQAAKLTDYIISIGYDTNKTKTVQEAKQQMFRWERMKESGFILNPDDMMDKTFLGEIKNQKEDIPKMFEKFFVTLSPEIQKVFKPLYDKLQNPEYFITRDDAAVLLNRYQNHVLNYILHTTKFKDSDGKQRALNQMYKDMFMGDESMAVRLYALRQSDDPEVADNLFVKELLPIITDGKNKTNNISLLRNRLDTYDINNIIEALNDLREYGKKMADPELVKFTDDITRFSIIQSGVQTSMIDFKKVLSTELYSELVKTILDSFKAKPNLDIAQVYRTFHQNNWNNRTIVSKAPSWIKMEGDIFGINMFSAAAQKDFYVKYVRNPKYQNQKIKDLKEAGKEREIWVPRLFQRTEYTDQSGLKILYYPVDLLGDGRNFTEIYTDVESVSVLPKNNLGDTSYKDGTVLNGTGRWTNLQEGMARKMSERYGEPEYLGGKNSYDAAGKKRFSPEGRSTPMGDGKDQAMRKAADSVIVEMVDDSSYSVGEHEYEVASDMLGRDPQETALIQVSAKNDGLITKKGNTYSSIQETPNVVMISRVLEFKSKTGLLPQTKKMIQEAIARNEDVVFILGDVPNVDNPIVQYLQSIGATYNLYYTGDAPRIAPVKSTTDTNKKVTTVFEELVKKANTKATKKKTESVDTDFPLTYEYYKKLTTEAKKKPMLRPLFEKLTDANKKHLITQIKDC